MKNERFKKDQYKVIGVMSGTSLDGVDVAYCVFMPKSKKLFYQIVAAETYSYNDEWKQRLSGLAKSSAMTFCQTHTDYGHYLGGIIRSFIHEYHLHPDFIASHGHTIFHQPENRMTVQIGHGAAIAAETGLPVINDFRSLDVAHGGQGAPLVPMGDKFLFKKFNYCLNLGGFANISSDVNGERIAYDICPCNTVLNGLANKTGLPFDRDGQLAKGGLLDKYLLKKLNALPYYSEKPPKSLGMEWVSRHILPLVSHPNKNIPDILRTFTEHIAHQVAKATLTDKDKKIFVTGGGAHNIFLIERITELSHHKILIPDKKIIDYKEALIFAFLGILRMEQQPNCLKSVTGADKNSSGGALFLP
ncbi:MAG: anhydro-N-acetylmuramic acid kinase [Bacteroidetes bacterium]|nr:anhydro-N-acetylmuramic acid kinase [Bacteroidota bacterium]